ncbi:MAG TPA: DegT/DnrJ/EryC1/StrS family aminotransferase [Acidobacteriota bacterium]|jgi:dTDP-4-amino-4,6-dideoxygalactose transaminase
MMKIPLSKPLINEEIKAAVLRVIESGNFILGKECEAFENELAAHTGTRYAVLTSSCTTGLFLLYSALGLRAGDEVIVPSHTAFPSIEPILHHGAKPSFVDVDETFTLHPAHVAAAINSRTVGILPVHLYGHPANLDEILCIARRQHLWVVEDCAQAQGAAYQGDITGGRLRKVGSFGTAGAFSFFPSKNLTVLGDGGCIVANDDSLAHKIRMLRNHGREEKYVHKIPGWNMRFNEIQAAVGRVALRELEDRNRRRRKIALLYNELLRDVVSTPVERAYARAVYHMYVVRVEGPGAPEPRKTLQSFLQERGVATGIHYPLPNHLQPAVEHFFQSRGWRLPALPVTEKMAHEILSLPMYPELTAEAVDFVCDSVKAFFCNAGSFAGSPQTSS